MEEWRKKKVEESVKEEKRKKERKNRGVKNYTENLAWPFFTLNLGNFMPILEFLVAPSVFKKTNDSKWPEKSEDIDASPAPSRCQFTYTMLSGLTKEEGQMVSNAPFPT